MLGALSLYTEKMVQMTFLDLASNVGDFLLWYTGKSWIRVFSKRNTKSVHPYLCE